MAHQDRPVGRQGIPPSRTGIMGGTALRLAAAAGLGTGLYLLARAARPPDAVPARPGPPHRVVIVGAGFGGLQAALRLARVPGVQVTVLDVHNHHLFQPLLYQVATAALAPDEIASPIRSVLAGKGQVATLMVKATGLDLSRREVRCEDRTVPYDTLVLATGSQVSYFGHESWRENALGLKTLDDALRLRHRILASFERAAEAQSPAERERHLTFLLVGAGATGVEMAGSIAELAQEVLTQEFQQAPGMQARVILVEAGPAVLAGFAPDLAARAAQDLQRMGVELRLNTKVEDIAPDKVVLGQDSIAAGTVVWTAGVEATPVAAWLGVASEKGGKVAVGPDLQVPGHPGVYVIGDAALARDARGKPLPGLAPVAKQQGAYVARSVRRRLRRSTLAPAFRYRDYGTLAAIGRNSAVAEIGALHLKGFPGWLAWAGAHIFFLISFRNRVLVSAQWLFSYATHRRGGRVIT